MTSPTALEPEPSTLPWHDANHRYLLAAVDVVRSALEVEVRRMAGGAEGLGDRRDQAVQALAAARDALPGPAALDRVTTLFGLSPFERDILLLGVGMETDAAFGALCAAVQSDASRDYPTFRLALDVLPDAHWGALSPDGALRRWRMVEVGPGNALSTSPIRLAERVLHELLGVEHLDDRLAGLVEPVAVPAELAPSHRRLVERVAAMWNEVRDAATFPVVQLAGGEVSDRRAVAAAAAARLKRGMWAMPAAVLPHKAAELEDLRRTWELEGALANSALLLECDGLADDKARLEAVAWLAERALGGVVVSTDRRLPGGLRTRITLEVETPPSSEQRQLWRAALDTQLTRGERQSGADLALVERLASQFHLGAPAIRAAGLAAAARRETEEVELGDALWEACRLQARPRLDELAERIRPASSWKDLVLPRYQREVLRRMAVHVRQRRQVYEEWGFDRQGGRGLGVAALFAGTSGTGKTMAAEVLADELRLDLYRIDLSSVVSKYIGETEKNLRQVFDAAEAGGVVLLFDEADALFGKRSEVKDSHDRHANIEVSYLLQRMESYRGLAILTTNIKSALDAAFLRRLRFIVEFPFPDLEQRAEIWRRVFPADTPTEGLDPRRLAQLNATGGIIRNVALHAAFLAADAGEPVRMAHLLKAARSEYAKLERPVAPGDVAGWV